MKSVKGQSMKDEVQQKIPEFASMDLLASYRDFLSGIPLYLVMLEHQITNKLYMSCGLVRCLISTFHIGKNRSHIWKIKAKFLSCIAV